MVRETAPPRATDNNQMDNDDEDTITAAPTDTTFKVSTVMKEMLQPMLDSLDSQKEFITQMVQTFTEIDDNLHSQKPKHRRLYVNSVKHRGVVASAMQGMASLTMQYSAAMNVHSMNILREFSTINHKKANPNNSTNFEGYIGTSVTDFKGKLLTMIKEYAPEILKGNEDTLPTITRRTPKKTAGPSTEPTLVISETKSLEDSIAELKRIVDSNNPVNFMTEEECGDLVWVTIFQTSISSCALTFIIDALGVSTRERRGRPVALLPKVLKAWSLDISGVYKADPTNAKLSFKTHRPDPKAFSLCLAGDEE